MAEAPVPTALHVRRASNRLDVGYADGAAWQLPAEYLRVESPSAAVQGHAPDQKKIIGGKRAVGIAAVEPIGHYAVRIRFTDGHDTGIYTWDYLHDLGREQDARWAAYLHALQERGLSRDKA